MNQSEERQVSPSVGEYAVLECARLKAENAELRRALQAAYDGEWGWADLAEALLEKSGGA